MLTVIIGQNLLSSVFIFTYRVKILWSFHHGFTLTSSHLSVCFHHTSQKTTVCPLKFMDFTTNAASNSPELNNLIWQPELNCWCSLYSSVLVWGLHLTVMGRASEALALSTPSPNHNVSWWLIASAPLMTHAWLLQSHLLHHTQEITETFLFILFLSKLLSHKSRPME